MSAIVGPINDWGNSKSNFIDQYQTNVKNQTNSAIDIHTKPVCLIGFDNEKSRDKYWIGYLEPGLVQIKHLLLGEFKFQGPHLLRC